MKTSLSASTASLRKTSLSTGGMILLTSFSQPLYFDPGSFSEAVRPETKRPAHRKGGEEETLFFHARGPSRSSRR